MKLSYRPDIDGLRAIAVLLVILYHAGLMTLSGGFIGVDVFFVISGFLITSIIRSEMAQESFSFKVFYRKRMKRILPPFYLVCLTSLVAGFIIFTPQDLVDLGKHLRYAVSFISNIFLLKNSGYFAPESEMLPLLHTWSLAIEEQFYLAWPALLFLVTKRLRVVHPTFLTLALCLSSLAYSQFLLGHDQDNAYYQVQSRVWELLLGAVLAISIAEGRYEKLSVLKSPAISVLMSLAGLGLIIVPAFQFTNASSFPGINALAPCLGTALVILSGSMQHNSVNKLLSSKPLVQIGLLSYSLYLWHWPIIAYTRYLFEDFGLLHAVICILISFVASLISYHLIEKPLRFNKFNNFKLVLLCYLVIPILIFVSLSKIIKNNDGFPDRFSEQVIQQSAMINSEYDAFLDRSYVLPNFIEKVAIGDIPPNTSHFKAMVWGDSHAMHLYALLDEIGKAKGIGFLASSDGACAPLINAVQLRYGRKRDKGCEDRNQATLDYILQSQIEYVVLSARWSFHYETTRYGNEGGASVYLGDDVNTEQSAENTQRVFRHSMESLVAKLLEHGKKVILVHQIPSHKRNVANCSIKRIQYPNLASDDCTIEYNEVLARQSGYRDVFQTITEKHPEVSVISFDSIICPKDRCLSEIDGITLYMDNDHLNPLGARTIAEKWLSGSSGHIFK